MKVAIPVELEKETVCPSFGRTPCYLLYNTENKEKEYLDNSAVMNEGGAGIKAAQILVDHNVDTLLTPRCGENAFKVLSAGAIKVYKIKTSSVQEALDDLLNGKLTALTDIHPGFHNHGGR